MCEREKFAFFFNKDVKENLIEKKKVLVRQLDEEELWWGLQR